MLLFWFWLYQFRVAQQYPELLNILCQETSAAAPGKRNSDKPKKYRPPCDGGFATVNLHKSAISALHEYIDGLPVENHSRICSLVSGVFN